ncbi:MAG: hypothetical protein DBP02_21855 [gamma proteobacterium symbiont of Ctena orbiculata]|nr:MAG: hypothetical protein DBP02_21855 [gamma proteobacterium symbiont of Ctena orbiculata]PUB84494.1 MAG: hypothetical protein DBP01_14945 [gamma proteobacterium symbiont of Ctena orbiculata]
MNLIVISIALLFLVLMGMVVISNINRYLPKYVWEDHEARFITSLRLYLSTTKNNNEVVEILSTIKSQEIDFSLNFAKQGYGYINDYFFVMTPQGKNIIKRKKIDIENASKNYYEFGDSSMPELVLVSNNEVLNVNQINKIENQKIIAVLFSEQYVYVLNLEDYRGICYKRG